MSKPKNVLVLVGKMPARGFIPQQTYNDNLFTEFNTSTTDANFYNHNIHSPSSANISEFDIYGFVPGNYKYTYDYSIERIVKFFEQNDIIEIVICDILAINPKFTFHKYIHPADLVDKNVPFFIKSSLKNKINFTQTDLLFQDQLSKLHEQRHTIFHIADPLISLTYNTVEGYE